MWTNVCIVGNGGFIGSRLQAMHPDWEGIDLKSGHNFCDLNVDVDANVIVLLAADLNHSAEAYAKNLRIYLAMVNRFKHKKVHIIYTSSAAVYPSSFRPVNELVMPQPGTIYGKSKLLGEQVITDTMDDYTVLRLANVYGDGDGKGAIDLFKNGVHTIYGDGQQVRDYVYVDDVCAAITKVVENLRAFNKMTLNISSGQGQTVNKIYEKHGQGAQEYVQAREFDVDYSVLGNGAAKGLGLL